MTYKITDEFLDKVMEMAQHADIMTASGVAIVNLNKFEAIRSNSKQFGIMQFDSVTQWKTDFQITKERMMKMRKTPKNAPILVTMILLPYVLIRTAMDLVMWLIDVICDGIQALGPRFQGFVTGMAATLAGLIILAGMAAYC